MTTRNDTRPTPGDDEPRTGATAALGRFSAGESRPAARPTLKSLSKLPYEGSDRLRDYVMRFLPKLTTTVKIPVIENGSIKDRSVSLCVHYGGALLSPHARVDNEVSELIASFRAEAIVLNGVQGGSDTPADTPDRPLLRLALVVLAINEMTDPNWVPAEALDLEKVEHRDRIRDTFTAGKNLEVHPTELTVAPGDTAVAFDPSLVDGASRSLDLAAVEKMYCEAKVAVLAVKPPKGRCYISHLDMLRSNFRRALETAITTIREADAECARNWVALAMLQAARPDAEPVRVLDVPGDWMVPADGKLAPLGGGLRTGRSAQQEAFRKLVIPTDATDQSRAVSKVVLLDPIRDLRALKTLGEWAEEERVVVYASMAQHDDIEDALTRATDVVPKGIHERWAQHVTVSGDFFNLDRGPGAMLSLPTNVVVAAGQSMLDRQVAVGGEAVSELASAFAGNQHKLFDLTGDARVVDGLVSPNKPRMAETLYADSVIDSATKGLVPVPVPRDGGDGFGMSNSSTMFRAPKRDSPDRVFESVAPVRIRNFVLRTVARHLRNHYLKTAIDQKRLEALQSGLQGWIESLDDRRTKRHLINAAGSKVAVRISDGNRLHVDVTLSYKPIVDKVSIADYASTDHQLEYVFDEDQGVWVPSTSK